MRRNSKLVHSNRNLSQLADQIFQLAEQTSLAQGNASIADRRLTSALFELYRLAAELGHGKAMYELAQAHEDSGFFGQNRKIAFQFYFHAAKTGYAPAYNSLAFYYQKGYGVRPNKRKALIWFSRGAQEGDAAAAYNLARSYQTGDIVVKSMKQAINWYRRAIQLGNRDAWTQLGAIELNAKRPNVKRAVSYLKKGLTGSWPEEAAELLAIAYVKMGPQYATLAKKWKARAKELGC